MSQESNAKSSGRRVRDEVELKDNVLRGDCRGKATGSAVYAPAQHAQPEKVACSGLMQVNNLGQCVHILLMSRLALQTLCRL